MPEPMPCCRSFGGYSHGCDLLVGLEGLRVIAVERDDGSGASTVTVESEPHVMGRPGVRGGRARPLPGRGWSTPRGRAGR